MPRMKSEQIEMTKGIALKQHAPQYEQSLSQEENLGPDFRCLGFWHARSIFGQNLLQSPEFEQALTQAAKPDAETAGRYV